MMKFVLSTIMIEAGDIFCGGTSLLATKSIFRKFRNEVALLTGFDNPVGLQIECTALSQKA